MKQKDWVYVFYLVRCVKGTKSGQAAANCCMRGNQALKFCGYGVMAAATDFDNLSDWVGNSQLDGVKFGGTPTRTIPSEA